MYFSLSSKRLTVAGDHPLLDLVLPGTASSFSMHTIFVSEQPSA